MLQSAGTSRRVLIVLSPSTSQSSASSFNASQLAAMTVYSQFYTYGAASSFVNSKYKHLACMASGFQFTATGEMSLHVLFLPLMD